MKKIDITISEKMDVAEFIKCISFISQEITDYKIYDDKVEFICSDNAQTDNLKKEIERAAAKYTRIEKKNKKLWESKGDREYQNRVMENEQFFSKFQDGMYGLNSDAIFLFEFFEENFEKMALEMGAVKKKYPVLLDVNQYKKTGYLKNSPQYAMFCCEASEEMRTLEQLDSKIDTDDWKDVLNRPRLALPPSACFYVYMEQKDKVLDTNKVYTLTQSVFRNEGRFNYADTGRLRDFHMREVVFIGDEQYVVESRNVMIEKMIHFLEELNLYGEIVTASDPFVLPKMQKFKKIQLIDECKYEIKLNFSKDNKLSVTSFNFHGTAFTFPFNISVKNKDRTVTGCVGIGVERWMIAFLSQYGFNHNNWPETVQNAYNSYT